MAALVSAVLSGAALALAACGGPSDEDFRADASKICAGATPGSSLVNRVADLDPSSREFADQAADFKLKVDLMRDDLSKLEVPEDLATDFDEFDGHLAEIQLFLGELSELTQTKQRVNANRLALVKAKAYVDARKLGLDQCVTAAHALALQVD